MKVTNEQNGFDPIAVACLFALPPIANFQSMPLTVTGVALIAAGYVSGARR